MSRVALDAFSDAPHQPLCVADVERRLVIVAENEAVLGQAVIVLDGA